MRQRRFTCGKRARVSSVHAVFKDNQSLVVWLRRRTHAVQAADREGDRSQARGPPFFVLRAGSARRTFYVTVAPQYARRAFTDGREGRYHREGQEGRYHQAGRRGHRDQDRCMALPCFAWKRRRATGLRQVQPSQFGRPWLRRCGASRWQSDFRLISSP